MQSLLPTSAFLPVIQVQLLTVLVRLEEVPPAQVRDVYKLLLDDSHAVRHAAAELVTDMLEESGQRHLAQVILPCFSIVINVFLPALPEVVSYDEDVLEGSSFRAAPQSCFLVMSQHINPHINSMYKLHPSAPQCLA